MKTPSFWEGVWLALLASLAAGALFSALTWVWPSGPVLRLLVTGLGLAYGIYLLARAQERVGRLTALLAWLAIASLLWLWLPPLMWFLLVQAGMVWLLRSLYYHRSVLTALVDLALSGFSLALALWAAASSGSLLLSVWCFFLVQALIVSHLGGSGLSNLTGGRFYSPPPSAGGAGGEGASDRFQTAHRAAETALRKIASQS